MRRLLSSCVGVFCAVALVGPALADEPPPVKRQRAAAPERVAAAPQQQGARWTGGQVGGSNGVSSVNNNFVDPGAFVCPSGSSFGSNCFETPFQFSGHKASYTIGPFVGYRVQIGGWVVGIEGDWSYKNAESSLAQSSVTSINVAPSSSTFFSPVNAVRTDSFAGSVKQKSDSSIRARVGWLVTPWSLLYVTGGVAFGEISGSFAYSGNLYSCGSPSTSVSACTGSSSPVTVATASTAVTWNDTRVGSTVGAGWESELFPGWKWRAEYRWTDFGDYTKTFGLATRCTGSPSSPASSCTSSPSSSVSINLKESFHTFRIGLAFDL
jgi:outer membrane immunogenic protein